MKPLRVVLDTNVLVSALVFGTDDWQWLRVAWQERRVLPLVSRATAEELLRVLAYPKFRLAPDERESLLADYLPYAEVVELADEIADVPMVRDPDDASFLALALAGKADLLVSGDDDLLSLATTWKRVPIMTPADLRQWLKKKVI